MNFFNSIKIGNQTWKKENLADIQINNVSVATEIQEKEEQMSEEYWDNDDADGTDEPLITDENVLENFINELFEKAK